MPPTIEGVLLVIAEVVQLARASSSEVLTIHLKQIRQCQVSKEVLKESHCRSEVLLNPAAVRWGNDIDLQTHTQRRVSYVGRVEGWNVRHTKPNQQLS